MTHCQITNQITYKHFHALPSFLHKTAWFPRAQGGQPDAGMFMEIIYFIDNWRNALERERRQPGSLSKLAGRQQLL